MYVPNSDHGILKNVQNIFFAMSNFNLFQTIQNTKCKIYKFNELFILQEKHVASS